MGKKWDYDVPSVAIWEQVYRVLKDGGRLWSFGGTRTYHRMVCGIEDAGFCIEDQVAWLYGCLSDDTEILIDGRWEPYHRANAGSLALCYNISDGTYTWQAISEVLVYPYDDTAYHIHSDRTDQIVSRNHRCIVERGGAYTFQLAEEAAWERSARIPVLEGLSDLLANLPLPNTYSSKTEPLLSGGVPPKWTPDATQSEHILRRLQSAYQPPALSSCAGRGPDMLQALQRDTQVAGTGQALRQYEGARAQGQEVRGTQSSMEGRRDLLSQTRELQNDQVRSLSCGIHADGTQGWLCNGASPRGRPGDGALLTQKGDCASRQPRSSRQPAGEPRSVREQSGAQVVRGAGHTVTDLARIEPVHYTGTVWCVRVPTGAFVARRNGKIFVTGNSGFPKHGSKLKPAHEPICVARKGSVSLLNIDAGRIAANGERLGGGGETRDTFKGKDGWDRPWRHDPEAVAAHVARVTANVDKAAELGRWPANVALDEEAARMLDAQSGISSSVARPPRQCGVNATGVTFAVNKPTGAEHTDSGGASRFFYCAKASAAERLSILTCDCEAGIISTCQNQGLNRDGKMDATSPARDTCEGDSADATGCSIASSGNELTESSRRDTKSIISTKINSTTDWKTCDSLRQSSISEYTEDVNSATGNGTSLAVSAERSSRLANITGGLMESPLGASHVVSRTPSEISVCERCGKPKTRISHPTQKPLALMSWLISLTSDFGHVILDPFAGSGSTLVAAEQLGRQWVGIELNPKYCEIARKRTAQIGIFNLPE
jgi:DNA modification methylase